ncbi:MAG: hypothetical protein ACR2PK_03850 [Acidimicrobiales bacterium]
MQGVAYAVVRSDPPDVFLADDIETLNRVLALELVAAADPNTMLPGAAESLREALLEERWADALVDWIGMTGMAVDVYTQLPIHRAREFDSPMMGARLQFAPLFRELTG